MLPVGGGTREGRGVIWDVWVDTGDVLDVEGTDTVELMTGRWNCTGELSRGGVLRTRQSE